MAHNTLTSLLIGSAGRFVRFRRLALIAVGVTAGAFADRSQADTFGTGPNSFTIDFVTIGNPSNPADNFGRPNPGGSVPYEYRIGRYEISESIIDKANASAGLGITKDTRGPGKPATSVSWVEAARFVNWFNTSKGLTPAYKFDVSGNFQLWAPGDVGYDPANVYRNQDARYVLPSTHEWYKAAYYDPVANVYYPYPTGSSTAPTSVASGTSPGTAVYGNTFNVGPADVTQAGGLSPYGTMGQGGNANEIEETDFDFVNDSTASLKGARGGSWNLTAGATASPARGNWFPTGSLVTNGFRVVSVPVPEPSAVVLALVSGGAIMLKRRTRVFGGWAIVLLGLGCAISGGTAQADTFGSGPNTFTIDFVPIGNSNNPADTRGKPNPAGSVPYGYYMGKHEVSRDMIIKASAQGSLGITLHNMTPYGGNGPNKPATGITWFEAAKFVNWLNTSTGSAPAYNFDANGNFQLWGPIHAGYNPLNRYRNSRAKYFLPSVHEWYKAAYFNPITGIYVDFPSGSMFTPTPVASGTGQGTAVFEQTLATGPADITRAGGLTPYGVMGMGGNVREWEETSFVLANNSALNDRGVRGGDWNDIDSAFSLFCDLERYSRLSEDPTLGYYDAGFRVASLPEPSSLALVALGLSFVGRAWRFRRTLTLAGAIAVGVASADCTQADTFGSGLNTFTIDFVRIGDPGNPADTLGSPNLGGSVPYLYRIAKFEVSESMIDTANLLGGLGITKSSRGPDKPTTHVTWFEAAEFVNWLNTSNNYSPAYKFDPNDNFQLWSPSDAGYNPNNLFRNRHAKYVLPSANEWYKAAYYDPTTSTYNEYPVTFGSFVNPDGIDFPGDPVFDAVFDDGPPGNANVNPNDITDPGQLSPYGTGGQGGNVDEWEESTQDLVNDTELEVRGYRGGNWDAGFLFMRAQSRFWGNPWDEGILIGFRVASVPEPSTILLSSVCVVLALRCRRRDAE